MGSVGGDLNAAQPASRALGASAPASTELLGGWQGLNYSSACTATCLPADPDIAVGNGYVFEVANTAYRIWTSAGGTVVNASLGSLFGTGADTLSSPQVRYDPPTLRWFASVEDVTRGRIYYAGTLSSDPTGSWNIQHITIPGGNIPTQPLLAVGALNLVLTTDLYRGGAFQGAQIWAANKSQILAGGGVAIWSDPPNPANISLVPADQPGSSAVTYLVSDGSGGSALELFTLSGSPPGTPTLSGPVAFKSVTTAPPSAVQRGTPNLVSTGTARVQSAVWRSGTLWASANVGCTPTGDSSARSCLHLWELSTSTSTKLQDFNWSTGPGTYDYFPAVSVNSAGDLALVFEESSATIYPGVYATAQTIADSPATLEPAQVVEAGTGPDNVSGLCPLGVCPYGNYSSAAFSPLAGSVFWLAGEYTATDSATNYWHTWVGAISVLETYRVTFTESNLSAGSTWSVTVNGVQTSSNSPTITLNESNGPYSFTVLSPIAGTPGSRFVADPRAGSFSVASSSVSVPITYVEQFRLTTSVTPAGGGTVYPSNGWFNASSAVTLSALAGAGRVFASWSASGSGSYAGGSNPAVVTMNGPISEQANFNTLLTFEIAFTEGGLPSGTAWTVVLNGIPNASSGSLITFNEPNGSYSFSTASEISGGVGTRYVVNLSAGAFIVDGSGIIQSLSYTTQFALTSAVAPMNSGSVSPSGGWFNSSSAVILSALAGPGHAFASWVGSGFGSYGGTSDPATITMNAPIAETAQFSTSVTYPVTFNQRGLPSGSSWTVTLNGVSNSSALPSLTFNEPNGTYSFVAESAIPGGASTQYVASAANGAFTIAGIGVSQTVSYITQFEVTISVTPANSGAAGPPAGWLDAGTVIELNALAAAGYQFDSWQGSGIGNYSGSSNPVNVTVEGPLLEVAQFSVAPSTSPTPPASTAPSDTVPAWVFFTALGAFVAALLILAAILRRRLGPPPPPEPFPPVIPPFVLGRPPVETPERTSGNESAGDEPWRE